MKLNLDWSIAWQHFQSYKLQSYKSDIEDKKIVVLEFTHLQ